MPTRIDPAALPVTVGTMYPSPYDKPCRARQRVRLGDAAGLTQFGVNQVTLVTGEGEEVLKVGEAAGFLADEESGHCLQNRTDEAAVFLEMGTRIAGDVAYYPGIDLVAAPGGSSPYQHTDGSPYEDIRRRGPDNDD